MPFQSKHARLDIPECNILSYLFPKGRKLSTTPLWIDAEDPSHSLSQEQALDLIKQLAVGLDNLGVGLGEAIMVLTPNHIYVPIVYLAASGSGRMFTGANPAYTATEVTYQMKAIRASVVFVHASLLDTGLKAVEDASIPLDRVFVFGSEPVPGSPVKDWRTMLASPAESSAWEWGELRGAKARSTVATVNFSSGTTGLPKGVCITHHNLVANAMQTIYTRFETSDEAKSGLTSERWLAFLPLYHAFSQLWTINIACQLERPTYVMSKFDLERLLNLIDKYQITSLQTVPPVLIMLDKRSKTAKHSLASLKHLVCGAAPLSHELQSAVSRRYGLVIAQGWGMTETTCVGTMVPGIADELSGSVGGLLPNTEAKLVDEGGNEITQSQVPGELYLRGPQVMLEYWENTLETQATKSRDGWLKTGDVAIVKNDQFWIVDRKKELIKVNGLQVAPAELEALLLEHDSVADAAVVGVTVSGNELPRAYVVLREESKNHDALATSIQKFVADRVAKHKHLRGGVVVVREIPKLASGKILRKVVREWAKAEKTEKLDSQTRYRKSRL